MMRRTAKIPLITIGGFLGAGKTTLVNRLLSQAQGRRIAVFVNDFGSINIDFDLIETIEEDRIALTNGCVCCSIRGDLIRAISRTIREVDGLDVAIVEASGISNPVGLSQSLRLLEDADLVRSELLIYVVDALSFPDMGFDEREEAVDFALRSDLVLINKCDIAPRERIDHLRSLLLEASEDVCVIESGRASIALDFLLGFDRRRARGGLSGWQERWQERWQDGARKHGFETWSGETANPFDREQFAEFAGILAKTCWRGKGVIHFTDAPRSVFVFNLVGPRATLEPFSGRPTGARSAGSSVVAIGRHGVFDPAVLESAFQRTTTRHRPSR